MTWMIELSDAEIADIRVAVQLRAEACEENEEPKRARRWRRILAKLPSPPSGRNEEGAES